MSKPRSGGNSEPNPAKSGLSLRLNLSEKVIVAALTLTASFLSGMTYGGSTHFKSDCNNSHAISAPAENIKP